MTTPVKQLSDEQNREFYPQTVKAAIADYDAPVIQMTTEDPGEGVPLEDNHFIAVYGDSAKIDGNDIDLGAINSYKYCAGHNDLEITTPWAGVFVPDWEMTIQTVPGAAYVVEAYSNYVASTTAWPGELDFGIQAGETLFSSAMTKEYAGERIVKGVFIASDTSTTVKLRVSAGGVCTVNVYQGFITASRIA